MKKVLIFISVLVTFSYSQNVKDLESELQMLKDKYVDFKAQSILKRDKIDKNIKLLDDEINQLYNSRNIVQQELLVSKDNEDALKANVETMKDNEQTFYNRMIELIDREKKKTSSLFPYLVETSILKLKDQDAEIKKAARYAAYTYLDYRRFLVQESEHKTIRETSVMNPKNELIKVKELRIGFIHNSYISDDGKEVGFLINKMTFSGPLFFWKNAGGRLKSDLNSTIFAIYNNPNSSKINNIPIDIGSAGEKLPYFLNADGTGKTNIFFSIANFFKKGGVLTYPLVLAALIAFIIMLERIIFFRKNRISISDETLKTIIETAARGDRLKAQKMCEVQNNILTRILSKLLQEKTFKDAEQSVEMSMTEEIPKLEKRLSTLGMIAGIAPLMGLLGTVVGMISLFDVITTYGSNNPKILAGGISIALITTQTGLAIAIPVIVVQHILVRIKNTMVVRIDATVTRALNKIYPL